MPYWTEETKPDRDDLERIEVFHWDSHTGERSMQIRYKLKGRCAICSRVLDVEGDARTGDCGGDCTQCMAEAGDPECYLTLKEAGLPVPIPPFNERWPKDREELKRWWGLTE